jgi:hypothetical protein
VYEASPVPPYPTPIVLAVHVPAVTVPTVVKLEEPANGDAPMVLYDTVIAVPPLNAVPDADPVPPLLNVTELVVFEVTVVEPPRLTELPLIVIAELVN